MAKFKLPSLKPSTDDCVRRESCGYYGEAVTTIINAKTAFLWDNALSLCSLHICRTCNGLIFRVNSIIKKP